MKTKQYQYYLNILKVSFHVNYVLFYFRIFFPSYADFMDFFQTIFQIFFNLYI